MKRSTVLAAAAFLVGGCTYLAAEAVSALGWTDRPYSYARNNISDLGIPDISPWHPVMNIGFVVDGALFALAGLGLSVLFEGRARWIVLGTSVVHGVGSIVVGLAHASVDGASTPHAAGAGMAIIGGNLVLLAAGRYGGRVGAPRWYTAASGVAGVAGLAGFALFLADTGILGGGAFERISVYTIIGWEIVTGAALLARARLSKVR
ncbi:DUF998 domain-containing protein [Rhodococcus sp. NKCM2511]|uniref:DUF998 domain-containing protein n=1 Tax=Rhodococcus sp. NKCM2511 TaxID=2766011 RepID=UPI00190FEA3B|nr:DUF998 domain-containing protein [Rhodococcus sp. NKCM2511]